jgi:hypothetical protein
MPRGQPKKSQLSNDRADKLLACLNYTVTKASSDYASAPVYLDACRTWHDRLSWQQRETVALAISAYTDRGEIVAERIAASLPPAPRCPF